MPKKNMIAAAVASVGLTAFGAAAQADTLIAPSTTTYEYTLSGSLQIPDSTYAGSSSAFFTQGQAETARTSSFGSATLNDGLVGNQAYLNTPGITQSGKYGARTGQNAYKFEGAAGQTGANGVANTATNVNNSSVYYNSSMTVVFNLGASHSDLSTVTIYGDWDNETGWGAFRNISIGDGVHTAVASTWDAGSGSTPPSDVPGGASGQYDAQGYYYADTINISSLSGQLITLTFTNLGGSFAPLNEIDFATTGSVAIPEPASLGLLGVGALGLMRRRLRQSR